MAPLDPLPPDHDAAHLTRALQACNQYRVAVDGGAHVGHWSRRLRDHFDTVHAFEPEPENFRKLEHVEGIEAHKAALGAERHTAALEPGPDNTGQWHLTAGAGVTVRPLDSFALQRVDLLKLDVEGYELQALQGAAATITLSCPVVLIEENGLCERYGVEPGAAGEWLEQRGYERAERMNKGEVWIPPDVP